MERMCLFGLEGRVGCLFFELLRWRFEFEGWLRALLWIGLCGLCSLRLGLDVW